jgi:hypothetical protein
MRPHSGDITRGGVVLFIVVALAVSAGVASAAVAGSFSSTYDGYDDSDTEARGHEIQVTGTIDISGESAVNPRITVRSTGNTVLDDSAVTLLQPGDSSVDFERRYGENGVVYTADEIPAGTTLNLEFVVYPVAGLANDEITSAQVVVTYSRPGGDRTRETFDIATSLSNSPAQALTEARNRTPEPTEPGAREWAIRGLAVVGALVIVLILLMSIYSVVSGGDDDNPLD